MPDALRPRFSGARPASGRFGDRANFQVHPGFLLQRADDAEQVLGGGIAVRAEHAHQAFRRTPEHFAQPVESDRRIDIGP